MSAWRKKIFDTVYALILFGMCIWVCVAALDLIAARAMDGPMAIGSFIGTFIGAIIAAITLWRVRLRFD